jgi:hypothetical protein
MHVANNQSKYLNVQDHVYKVVEELEDFLLLEYLRHFPILITREKKI